MKIDINEVFSRGGKPLIEFLTFCVMSIYMDPVFRFLVGEYRTHPATPRALGLYDVFCHPQSVARINAAEALSPKDVRLEREIDRMRANVTEVEAYNATEPEFPRSVNIPAKYLFDRVLQSLETNENNSINKAVAGYDPALSPTENLPGGKMNEAQRQFVEHIWQPHYRPHLVAAGFRRIANIG